MISIEFLLKWQDSLWKNTASMSRIGVGYGLGGNLFYYLLLNKLYRNKMSQLYISETVKEILSRINSHQWNYPDLSELYYLMVTFMTELSVHFDLSELVNQINDVLLCETKRLIDKKMYDPYLGAFNFGYVSLILGLNGALVNRLINLIKVDFSVQEDLGQRYFRYSSSPKLNITHGTAFYLMFLSLCKAKKMLNKGDLFLIQELCCYILKHRTDYTLNKSLFNDGTQMTSQNKCLNISYGDCGIIYSLICGNRHLKKKISDVITTLLAQNLDGNCPNGFGLLYGYSGIYLFFRSIGYWNPNSANIQRANLGYSMELDRVKLSIMSEGPVLPINFFDGITGCLALYIATKTKDLKKVRELLYLV